MWIFFQVSPELTNILDHLKHDLLYLKSGIVTKYKFGDTEIEIIQASWRCIFPHRSVQIVGYKDEIFLSWG